MIQRETPHTIDVLFVGSSHVFTGINPNVLWLDDGIAAFNFGSQGQPMYVSYHYIIEALKTQSPTVIVLDVLYACWEHENGYYMPNWQGIFSAFPFSANKLNMVSASIAPDERVSHIIDLIYFHDRWRDIGKDSLPYSDQAYAEKDIYRYKGYYAASNLIFRTGDIPADYNSAIYPSTAELGELPEKNRLYLLKIIELAKEEGIALVLIKTPTLIPFTEEDEQKAYNTVGRIATENQIPFIDFNKDEYREAMGFDFATDLYDDNHLNISGAEKLSKYIATLLKANYNLPDRRGNPAYHSWDEAAKGYLTYVAVESARIEEEQLEEEDIQ
jgi:hypothetical protein